MKITRMERWDSRLIEKAVPHKPDYIRLKWFHDQELFPYKTHAERSLHIQQNMRMYYAFHEGKHKILLAKKINTVDRGDIWVMLNDAHDPAPYTEGWINYIGEDFINACGFKVIPNSRRDSIIDLRYCAPGNPEPAYKGISSRVLRSVNRPRLLNDFTVYILGISGDLNEFRARYLDTAYYRIHRFEEITKEPLYYITDDYIRDDISFVYMVKDNRDNIVAMSWVIIIGDTMHWKNMQRRADVSKPAIGNSLIMAMLTHAVSLGLREFNMGIDIYPYKKEWTKTTRPVMGIQPFLKKGE